MQKFWRGIAIFLLGGMLGTGFGVALGFFFFPYVFPPPPAAEQLSEADRARLVATGTFIHANPSDPVHWGRGKVTVYERALFLEPDFEVGPGPAYRVYLVPKSGIRRSSDLEGLMYVDLGGLRAFKGSQRYPIPRRRQPEGFSQRDHLVRAVQRADLARGSGRQQALIGVRRCDNRGNIAIDRPSPQDAVEFSRVKHARTETAGL